GLAVNVLLLVVLTPGLGIAGAGLALAGAYVAMLVVMRLLTRRLFRVDFEWKRIAQLALVLGGLAGAGELLLPTSGAAGFVSRALLALALPLVLSLTGFYRPDERAAIRTLIARVRRAGPAAGDARA